MKTNVLAVLVVVVLAAAVSYGQESVVVVDPTLQAKQTTLSAAEQKVFDRNVLPRFTAKYTDDGCTAEPEVSGIVRGSFDRAKADQRLVFFQFCQTGNGLGVVGLVLIENGKAVGTWGSNSGWSDEIGVLPDINGNGVNEFTLSYGGGMHQGEGGVGVDIMEFAGSNPRGLGWFQSLAVREDEASCWKVTVKPGAKPLYFKQKYKQVSENKWRRVGTVMPLKLTKASSPFEVVK